MELVVVSKRAVAEDTILLTLAPVDGDTLPTFKPGAHIELSFAGLTRRYSITSSPHDSTRYEVCVLRAYPSRGGSEYLHNRLSVGDKLQCAGPFNSFPLRLTAVHTVFIAGGIGVTPFLSMMEALKLASRSFELHYAVRSVDRFLPLPDYSGRIWRYTNVNGRSGMDVDDILSSHSPDVDLYVCGPRGMIEAVRGKAKVRGWPKDRIHFEGFGVGLDPADAPIRVHLALSGMSIEVDPGTPILDALLANGVWAPYECRRGECGSCLTEVIAGNPDHRDLCLTEEQRAGGMCTCVSWGRTTELVLNL